MREVEMRCFKLLIDYLVQFCDEQYSSFHGSCGCESGNCNHPQGTCSGSCYDCLYHIHFPERAPANAKREYDCVKMLYHYVCQYSYLYTMELLCALRHEWNYIKDFPYYHILSLGCGGCADLMAFDFLRHKKGNTTPISYFGIDINKLWIPIHNRIAEYSKYNNIIYSTCYCDAFEYLRNNTVPDANIVVISYLISYLCDTEQFAEINSLAQNLARHVISNKRMPLLLVINDVNSYKRGRNAFRYFEQEILNYGLNIAKSEYKYFDTGNLYNGQKLGTPYSLGLNAIGVPREIKQKYHAGSSIKETVQLLVEVS